MPENVSASSRLYRRLAEGVQRTRLVEPIQAGRPPLVVIRAPSGYGKTVLAAQTAASVPFEDVLWVDCGGGGSVGDDLARLASMLSSSAVQAPQCPDAIDACTQALAAMGDEHSMLVVLDDAGWAGDSGALAAVRSALAEAPLGSVTIITSRCLNTTGMSSNQVWEIGVEELRLTDDEVREAWCRFTGAIPDERSRSLLIQSSGRHFALLSLLGRNASLMGAAAIPPRCSESVSSLLKGLVRGQLDEAERDLLNCAAVLGDGTLAELTALSQHVEVRERLNRVSHVIPLVSVCGEGSAERFVVHDLVAEALGSARALAGTRPDAIVEALGLLETNGKLTRALEIAARSGEIEALADCVERTGSRLLQGSGWRDVCAALDMLPSAAIASRPGLLLVKAEGDWASGRRAEGIRQAELAIRIEELAAAGERLPRALALLAGMRMVLADFSGIAAEVGPLMDDESVRASDRYGEILYAAIAAFGLLGDRSGLARAVESVSRLAAHSQTSPFVMSRIDSARASVADLLEGDPLGATRLMRRATSREGIPSHWRVGATCNVAALALESGDIEGATDDLATAMTTVAECGAPSDHAIRRLLSETIGGLSGEAVEIELAIEALLDCCVAEGERFTYVFTCIRGAEVALSLRHVAYARDLSERGVATALETGGPVPLWLAELVQAQACLAMGESERAAKTAQRLLPRVESIQAMGHVLHARMILAEVALREADLASAIEHLSTVSDYIVEKTPALVVASYLRAFPDLLGPLAHVVGVERLPAGVLRCLAGPYADDAVEASAAVLTQSELSALKSRMRAESGRREPSVQVPAPGDPVVEVRLFGGLEVKTAHGIVAQRDWGKRKARLLFAMLVARHGTDVHRAEIIDYLWPDLDEAHGVNNFYVVWSAMKRAVSPKTPESDGAPPFENHNGVCRAIPTRLVSDLDLFMTARNDARRAKSVEDAEAEAIALRTAIELYRGDVLPGDIYDDWFGSIRQRFRQEYQAAVIRFANLMLEAEDPLAALPFVIQASERDPLREDLYQTRIRLEVGSNQRGAAMATYMSCRNTLIEELGIDPSRETVELYQQILAMEDVSESSEYSA